MRTEAPVGERTSIAWTDTTWNPVRGCSRVSEGCRNCYAERQAARFSDHGQYAHGFVERTPSGPRWTGKVELVPEKLDEPLGWLKPRRVFVNSMSDLFHEALPFEAIDMVFAVMALAWWHTFQVLTKRPERMREYMADRGADERTARASLSFRPMETLAGVDRSLGTCGWDPWPRPNVWLGVSVEDQATADERIPLLMETPAAVRFLSCEPLLGPVDVSGFMWPVHDRWPSQYRTASEARADGAVVTRHRQGAVLAGTPFVKWVIAGGESGPKARPCDVAWILSLVEQCREAGVPAFVKQLGARPEAMHANGVNMTTLRLKDAKGADPSEWPEDLRVQEFPA